jgi:hypothetical protein
VLSRSDTGRMNPWLRVLAVFGGAIAAALFLRVLPPIIVLVFFVGGIAAVNLTLRRRVKNERGAYRSETLGLKRGKSDPFGLLGYPFALFSRCEQAAIEDVRWGAWRGLDVKRFDLSCSTPSGDERTRFACAIGPAGPSIVPLVVEAEAMAALLSEPAMGKVDIGSPGYGRPSVVRCDDPAFARAIVGPPMLRWLGGLEEPWGFEMHGSLAVVYGPPSSGVEDTLERLQAFVELAQSVLSQPHVIETVPTRSDALPPNIAGLGEGGGAT